MKEGEVIAEFGSDSNIRWPDSSNATLYDSEGEVMLCKCGKPAGSAIMGKEEFVAFCSDCSPYKNLEKCEIVMREPISDEKLKEMGFVGKEDLKEAWTFNLRGDGL